MMTRDFEEYIINNALLIDREAAHVVVMRKGSELDGMLGHMKHVALGN